MTQKLRMLTFFTALCGIIDVDMLKILRFANLSGIYYI